MSLVVAGLVALLFTLFEAVLAFRGEGVEAEALCVLGRALGLVGFRVGSALVDFVGALLDVLAVHLGRRRRRRRGPCRSDNGLRRALGGLSLVFMLAVKGVVAQALGIFGAACRLVGSRGSTALVVTIATLLGAFVLWWWRCRLRGPRGARLGARRGSHEAVFVRVVAQTGGVLGSTLGLVGVRLGDAGIVSGGAVCGAFVGRGGTPVGKSSGDEGRDDDGGTHLDGFKKRVSFLFLVVESFVFLILDLKRVT